MRQTPYAHMVAAPACWNRRSMHPHSRRSRILDMLELVNRRQWVGYQLPGTLPTPHVPATASQEAGRKCGKFSAIRRSVAPKSKKVPIDAPSIGRFARAVNRRLVRLTWHALVWAPFIPSSTKRQITTGYPELRTSSRIADSAYSTRTRGMG